MESLSSSYEAYCRTFQVYLQNSTVAKTVSMYAYDGATNVTRKVIKSGCNNSPVFRVLGVGSGSGEHDIEILTAVATSLRSSQTEKPAIHACIVEPSHPLIADFKTTVSTLPESLASLADVSFDFRETTFEQYIGSSPESECFDMVHFICSLYYIHNVEECLMNCIKRLNVGGAMFCLITGDESFYPRLMREFREKLNFGPTLFHTEKDVVAIAERNNWRYEELPKAGYTVDITSCYDQTSKTGGQILDFLTHQKNFRGTADQTLYKAVMDFLSENSTADEQGRRLVKPENSMVVIYK